MLLSMLRAKLHNATVTDLQRDYEGSLGIDSALMDAVKMRPYEKILVANLSNGNRFETYAIPTPADSGTICLNGAAALLGKKGDRIIIIAFAMMEEPEAAAYRPLILTLGPDNRPSGGLKPV